MRALAALVAFLAFMFVFWGGWYALFGSPTGGTGIVALAISLMLLRVGWHVFDRVYPEKP